MLGRYVKTTDQGILDVQARVLEQALYSPEYRFNSLARAVFEVRSITLTAETKTLVNDGHWMGTALAKCRAYLSIRNLYSADLETGDVDWEWPLSAPPPDLIDK